MGDGRDNRRTLFVIASAGLLTFGVVLTTLGAVLPLVIERFGIGRAAAGALLFLNTLGIIVGSLLFGPVVDRYGYKEMLLAALAIVIAGMEGIAFAPSMTALRIAVVLAGVGAGMINGGTNALVADISTEDRTGALGRLAIFFGVGAVGMPFVLGSLLGAFPYPTVIAALGAAVLIPLVATAATGFPSPKQAQGFPLALAGRLLRDPVLLTLGAALFLESGMELTVGGWTTSFFTQELRSTDRAALACLSLYWSGMMLGRIGMTRALRVLSPMRLLRSCLTVGFIGCLLFLASRQPVVAALGVFLIGLGFAATFPAVLGMVADRYAALSGTAFSVVMVMALTGGTVLPFVVGVVSAPIGLRVALAIVPIALVLLMTLLTLAQPRLVAPGASSLRSE
jgi:fucose permease